MLLLLKVSVLNVQLEKNPTHIQMILQLHVALVLLENGALLKKPTVLMILPMLPLICMLEHAQLVTTVVPMQKLELHANPERDPPLVKLLLPIVVLPVLQILPNVKELLQLMPLIVKKDIL